MRVIHKRISILFILGRGQSGVAVLTFAAGLGLGGVRSVLGDSILSRVPADVAGVIVLPHAKATADRATEWCVQLGAGAQVADVEQSLTRLGLPLDLWDESAPVALLLVKPNMAGNWVVCFKPKSAATFAAAGGAEVSGRVHQSDKLPRAKFVFSRGGYVFAAPKRKTAELIASSDSGESLWRVLDARQQALYGQSDLFIHLNMAEWQDKVAKVVQILTGLVKLGAAAPQGGDLLQAEAAKAMVDWFADGFEQAVEQMQGVTLAFSIDEKGLSFSHYHSFKPGGSVAEYLSQVKATGIDLWAGLPNRPFIVFCGADWSCPAKSSLGARLTEHLFGIKALAAQLPKEQREAVIRETAACYGQMQGMNLVATTPPKQLRPIEVYGSYTFEDAEKGIEQMRLLERHAAKLASCFKPVAGCLGPVKHLRRDGVEFDEMRFDVDALDERSRKSMVAVYGENCRYQQAQVGPTRVAYVITESPDAICRLVTACKAGIDGIGDNHPVQRVMKALPARANAVAIVDLSRFYAVGRHFVHGGTSEALIEVSSEKLEAAKTSGPLVGWAGVVEGGNFLGQLYLGVGDAIGITKLAEELGAERRVAVPPGNAAKPNEPSSRPADE